MGVWDINFIQRPDAVTGLQRRTGSYFNEFKVNLQERIEREHRYELADADPQLNHGTHTEGSAKIYVTALDDPDPTDRPTGGAQTAQALDDEDRGRMLMAEDKDLKYYKDGTDGWVKIDTTIVGSVVVWPGTSIPENWLLCDGQDLERDEYPALWEVCGTLYGNATGTSFKVPNLQGIYPLGQGQQDIDGRTKGYTDTLGTVKEDQMQELSGYVRQHPIYSDSNAVVNTSGIFTKISGGSNARRLDRASGDRSTKGFQIDLDNPDPPIRRGEFNHPSSLLMNFIIKAL